MTTEKNDKCISATDTESVKDDARGESAPQPSGDEVRARLTECFRRLPELYKSAKCRNERYATIIAALVKTGISFNDYPLLIFARVIQQMSDFIYISPYDVPIKSGDEAVIQKILTPRIVENIRDMTGKDCEPTPRHCAVAIYYYLSK